MARVSAKQIETGRKADPTRIVDAAIACFRKFGVNKTNIEDVAEAAGVSRQTVYRTYSNRSLLLEAVAARRLSELATRLRPIVSSYKTFEDALILGSIDSVVFARKDKIYRSTVDALHHMGMERYMVGPRTPMVEFMDFVWHDVFVSARQKGELRDDLTDAEIQEWLRGVHLLLYLRDDLTPERTAELMRKFLIPALLSKP